MNLSIYNVVFTGLWIPLDCTKPFISNALYFLAWYEYTVITSICQLIERKKWFPGYIGEFEIVDDHRAGKIVVNLTGRLIKCGVISPRFDVSLSSVEKWTTNLLPSRQFG